MICEKCGSNNRPFARYCWSCAAPLAAPRPTADDTRWLAATLSDAEASMSTSSAATADTAPLNADAVAPSAEQEKTMSETQSPEPIRFAGRYEIQSTTEVGEVTALDHQPWKHCWACGSTTNDAGEGFCTNCGAALEQRTYHGTLSSVDAPTGAVLLADVAGEQAQAVLPEIWDDVQDDGQRLVLLHGSGRASVVPPLDEVAALQVGKALAHLLASLHEQGLALGALSLDDLELTAAGEPRLRNAPHLQRITAGTEAEAVSDDLTVLAELLEALTATPRTTQRLDEESALAAAAEPGLPNVLRDLRTKSITDAAELATQIEALLAERTRPLPLHQQVGAASDTGIVRDHNEDSMFTLTLGLDNDGALQTWGCYIVADGMGGHAAGEVASGLATRGAADVILSDYLSRSLERDASYDDAQARNIVLQATLRANEYVVREGERRGNDMGTTLTMALVVGDRATIANVGDSRTYLFREGKLTRISKDHSLVMRLVEIGQISEEDIYTHPQRNAVLRSLGDSLEVDVDVFSQRVQAGDALVLCSDGQWEMTHTAEMERLLDRDDDPQQICRELVQAANQAGGEDNITVVLVRFEV